MGSPRGFLVFHTRLKAGSYPAVAESMTEVFGIISYRRRDDLRSFARSAPIIGVNAEGIQPGHNLDSLVSIDRCHANAPRPASGVRQVRDEEAFALPSMGHSLTAAFAGENMSHPRRRSVMAACRVLRPAQACRLASLPGSCRNTSAVATNTRHSWTSIEHCEEDYPSGSRCSRRRAT
jgi:hypothetical protein